MKGGDACGQCRRYNDVRVDWEVGFPGRLCCEPFVSSFWKDASAPREGGGGDINGFFSGGLVWDEGFSRWCWDVWLEGWETWAASACAAIEGCDAMEEED